MENNKDQQLWHIARKRAHFKKSLTSYVLVNLFLWCIYFLSHGFTWHRPLPWPVWVMLGWGIGLFFQYQAAYGGTDLFSTEKEYEKLKQDNRN
jgi:hypothetical protein